MVANPPSALQGSVVASLAFGLLLAAVCVSDLRTRRIPNALVLVIAATGVARSVFAARDTRGAARVRV